MLKICFLLVPLILSCTNENDGSTKKEKEIRISPPTNSFISILSESDINYKYDSVNQVHDYSENWDIDGDGIHDNISFHGNGGAHLQYSLQIELSSSKSMFKMDWIFNDDPLFERYQVKGNEKDKSIKSQFTVYDFNKDGLLDIFFKADDFSDKSVIRDHGLRSSNIIFTYNKNLKQIEFLDY